MIHLRENIKRREFYDRLLRTPPSPPSRPTPMLRNMKEWKGDAGRIREAKLRT